MTSALYVELTEIFSSYFIHRIDEKIYGVYAALTEICDICSIRRIWAPYALRQLPILKLSDTCTTDLCTLYGAAAVIYVEITEIYDCCPICCINGSAALTLLFFG